MSCGTTVSTWAGIDCPSLHLMLHSRRTTRSFLDERSTLTWRAPPIRSTISTTTISTTNSTTTSRKSGTKSLPGDADQFEPDDVEEQKKTDCPSSRTSKTRIERAELTSPIHRRTESASRRIGKLLPRSAGLCRCHPAGSVFAIARTCAAVFYSQFPAVQVPRPSFR